MTTTVVDGLKITISLDISVEYDEATGGFFVVEQDGSSHSINWGPMPGFLVQALIRDRGESIARMWRQGADDSLHKHFQRG